MAHDYTTGAYAEITYSSKGASQFVGNSDSTANSEGFFTGLMTEQYYTKPYYGNSKFVTYSSKLALTSATLWVNQFNTVTNHTIFNSLQPSSLVTFDNYHQLHQFTNNGATEYANAYDFYTGADPVSMSLSAKPILADDGMKTQASFTASASGGTTPYTYLVYLDNKLVCNNSLSKSLYSTTLPLGTPSIGDHHYYVNVLDSKGNPASSQTITFSVNLDPTLMISSQSAADQGQVVKISYQTSLGTPPYNATLYLNGVGLPQANLGSEMMRQIGQNQVYVRLTDAAGFKVTSNALNILVNPDPVVSVTSTGFVTDAGLPITLTESLVGGTVPFSVSWLVDGRPAPGSDASFRFVGNSSATYSVSVQITDGAGYLVKSTPSTLTVNTDPVVSYYSSTGKSTNFFLTNNTAQSEVDISGGTPPYVYNWYLNGLIVGNGGDSTYSYAFSGIGSNLLQVEVSDAAGYHVASETTRVNFGIDFLHIGVVVLIVVVALYLVIFRLGKGRGSKSVSAEEQEPTLTQQQVRQAASLEKQESLMDQPSASTISSASTEKQEPSLVEPQLPPTSTSPTTPVSEDPVAILKLRYAKGEITKEQYEEILRTLRE